MAIAVVKFPGTNNEEDMMRALTLIRGANPYIVTFNEENASLDDANGLVVLGGMLDGNLIGSQNAALVESLLDRICDFAAEGKPVLGTSGGFHVLMESGLLPGSLVPNGSERFLCQWVNLRISDSCTPLTDGLEGLVLRLPLAHGSG
ncbi:MAG: phosphoribosylformylglycinamidine synthase subunit PurQ, partial [Candidatus Thorarchaeota archaeon]